MILHAYAVLDLKGDAFASPFFLHTDAIAIRTFNDAISDPSHPMSKHPEDYVLYRLGDFNDQDGSLVPVERPVSLMSGTGDAL